MIKKTALGVAAAAAITATSLAGTTSTAQAGNWSLSVGIPGPVYYGGFYGGHGFYGNPCRHWKRKWRRTGKHYFLRRYRRCMNYYF